MIYALPLDMLTNIIKEAVSIGEHKKAQELGKEPRFISQRKAYKLYTETSVDRWIENGIRSIRIATGNGPVQDLASLS